jgi:hypothetical protein
MTAYESIYNQDEGKGTHCEHYMLGVADYEIKL